MESPGQIVYLQKNLRQNKFQNDLGYINLDYFKYFIVLSRVQNFSKASSALKITQQALSKAIISLENQVGHKLIERDRKFNKLTSYGQYFLERSEDIIQNLHEILGCNFLIGKTHQLKISWVGPVGNHILPKLLKKFSNYNSVFYYNVLNLISNKEVEESILLGDYDVGFMTTEPQKNLSFLKLTKTNFIIVGNEPQEKNWKELSYICPSINNLLKNNNYFINIWDNNLYPRKIKAEVDTINLAVKLCILGFGSLHILSEFVKNELENGDLYIISEPPFNYEVEIYMIWNEKRLNKEIFRNFLNFMQTEQKMLH